MQELRQPQKLPVQQAQGQLAKAQKQVQKIRQGFQQEQRSWSPVGLHFH